VFCVTSLFGPRAATENAGPENKGPPKMHGWKTQDWKMQDHLTGGKRETGCYGTPNQEKDKVFIAQ